jgi:hypothetical protein
MPTLQENDDAIALQNERFRLNDQKDLLSKLGLELSEVRGREDAGRRILAEIEDLRKNHPEDFGVGDHQRATAALPKLTAKRAEIEVRISNVKRGISVIEASIARFDLPKLARLEKIRGLFRQLAG